MYCPSCGQQQASEEIRFCSRCGFPLGLVAEVLANGGTLPQLLQLSKKPFFSRRNGLIFSLFWFIFFVLIITPFWGIVDVEEMAAFSAIVGVFGGLLIFLFSLFFLKKHQPSLTEAQFSRNETQAPNYLRGNQTQNALPPQQTQPAQDYVSPAGNWRAPDTGDLVQPGSVTEGTTKLLNKDD
ncbi:MAG: hypothetical protein R2747_04205 [Pyrinomonadaceae bacterium]